MPDALSPDQPDAARRRWMAVLARADVAELGERLEASGEVPSYRLLRGPESGLVMVRGRTGGGGAPFNLGEMTVTRCSVRAGGQVGHAYRAGRGPEAALLAARIDAALQDPMLHEAVHAAVVRPLA